VSVWADVFLGVIAVATLSTAIVQIAVIVAAGRAAKRMADVVDQFSQDVKPIIGQLNAMGRDASRATALAVAQVERADRLFTDVALRVDETLSSVQASIGKPAREGRAMWTAFRVAFDVIREMRRSGRSRSNRGDDEDALFI
jgi:hypothetical protein